MMHCVCVLAEACNRREVEGKEAQVDDGDGTRLREWVTRSGRQALVWCSRMWTYQTRFIGCNSDGGMTWRVWETAGVGSRAGKVERSTEAQLQWRGGVEQEGGVLHQRCVDGSRCRTVRLFWCAGGLAKRQQRAKNPT